MKPSPMGLIILKKEGIRMNLQESILKELVEEKVPATFFLMNGFQIRGILTAYDSVVIVVVTDSKHQVFYKHAISTIAPIRPLKCLIN